jgi:beta-lactamase class A
MARLPKSSMLSPVIDRRFFLIGSGAALLGYAKPVVGRSMRFRLAAIEASLGRGGRLGVAALNTTTGQLLTHRPNERFALCSTFKVALAAAWLAKVDRGRSSLNEQITFGDADLTDYAPVIRANLRLGRLSLEQLCAAVVELSDNAAANLLLEPLGGPAGFTRIVRGWGDGVTRLDRYEEQLGTNLPGDVRDTTSPAAMLGLMRRLLVEDVLTPASRAKLIGWMEGATTGLKRLRSGLPRSWKVGDKTGNGRNGAANDIAIGWPPGASPILIACYMSGGTVEPKQRDAGHAAVAEAVVQAYGYR